MLWLSLAGSRMVSMWLYAGRLATPEQTAQQFMSGNPLDRNILSLLILAGVGVLVARGPRLGALLRSNRSLAVFFIYGALSIAWSDYPDVAFKRWTKALGDIVMISIVLTDARPATALQALLARVGFLLVPTSVLLIRYFPEIGREYSQADGEVRFCGVAVDKNMLGVLCLVAGLPCVWRLLQVFRNRVGGARARVVLAHGTLLLMVLWLFGVAHSMTALSCFAVGLAMLVPATLPALQRNPALMRTHMMTVLGFAFAVLFLNVGTGLIEAMGKDPTLTGRTGLWRDLLGMDVNPLIGTGFESFWLGSRLQYLWDIYWWHPNEAHNGYLEVFLNLGLVGVALLGAVLLAGYRNVIQAVQRDDDTAGLRLAFFAAGTVYGFTEAAFRVMSPMWIVFVLAVLEPPLTQAASRETGMRPERRDPAARYRCRSGWTLAPSRRHPTGVAARDCGAVVEDRLDPGPSRTAWHAASRP